jgi:hypothetical protein
MTIPHSTHGFAGRRTGKARDHRDAPADRPAMSAVRPAPSPPGTQRRLQALMARAWSPRTVESATGIPAGDISRILANERNVTPELAVAVARAYDQLWDREPPRSTREDRHTASAALARAHRRGWAPPMAWDDDQLDQPDGKPTDNWKPASVTLRRSAIRDRPRRGRRMGPPAQRLPLRHRPRRSPTARRDPQPAPKALGRAREYATRGIEAEAG